MKRIFFLIAAGLAAYSNSFWGVFLFDDRAHIVEKPLIHSLWPLTKFLTLQRPLLHWSLALNYAVSGMNPWSYHLLNLVIHISAGLVLFGILRRTINVGAPLVGARLPQGRAQGPPLQTFRNDGLAFSIALLWLVHPLQTQSVTYVIQRSESMMGLFYLFTLYAVIRGHQSEKSFKWHSTAVISCALGMATKEVMVTAPILILFYDRIFLSHSWKTSYERKKGLFLGLFSTWLVLGLTVFPLFTGTEKTAGFAVEAVRPWQYFLTQTSVILHYLRLVFWPHPLCIDYAWPFAQNLSQVFLPLLIIAGLFIAALAALRFSPALGFLGLSFFLILSPTSSFMPIVDPAFEHRMYLPLAAVITLVVIAASTVIARTAAKGGGTRQSTSPQIAAATFGMLPRNDVRMMLGFSFLLLTTTAFGILTFQRNQVYASELAIWQDTVAQRPLNPRAYSNLASVYIDLKQMDLAETYARKAIELSPEHPIPNAFNSLGIILDSRGQVEDAAGYFSEAARLNPQFAKAHYNLGIALSKTGKPEEAKIHFSRAIELNPNYFEAYHNYAVTLTQQGKLEEAKYYFGETLRLNPRFAKAHNNLGKIFALEGKMEEALKHFEKALEIAPADPEGHYQLGNIFAELHHYEEAVDHYRQAIEARPDNIEYRNNMGAALFTLKKYDEAAVHFSKILELNPNHADARKNLELTLAEKEKLQAAP